MKNLISSATIIALLLAPAYAGELTGPVSGGGGGGGSGTVTSIATSCGVSGGTITTTGTISATLTARNTTATTDTLVTGDCGTVVTESNASPVAVSIAAAGSAGFATGYFVTVANKGAGLVTITPTTSTIGGASTATIKQNQSLDFYSDGTNYIILPGKPSNIAASDLTGIGTNVATAINTTLSAAGGLTSTIASGTSALGTGAISSAACATVVTTSATNTATTDVVLAGFNGDPTAVTGYTPVTTGALTIFSYPTANNVNFKVCNLTSSSITPGAITLNWRVVR